MDADQDVTGVYKSLTNPRVITYVGKTDRIHENNPRERAANSEL